MSPPAVAPALERVLRFLDGERVQSMLLGGLAIRVPAIPRPTFDGGDVTSQARRLGVTRNLRAALREARRDAPGENTPA